MFNPFSHFRRKNLEATLPPGVTLTPRSAAPQPPAPSEVEALNAKISSLTEERDSVAKEFASVRAELYSALEDIKSIKVERDTAVSERDAARAEAAKTREEVTAEVRQIELASLAASQGIPAAEIVPANGPGADPAQDLTDTIKAMQATSDPREKGRLAAKASALRDTLKNKK